MISSSVKLVNTFLCMLWLQQISHIFPSKLFSVLAVTMENRSDFLSVYEHICLKVQLDKSGDLLTSSKSIL